MATSISKGAGRAWLALCLLAACSWAQGGIVIRAGACSADAFRSGSGVLDDGDGNIQGLSVNCVSETSDVKKYANYLTGIGGYNSYCVATTVAVGKAGGVLKTDKLPTNRYHCLLAGKAKDLANVMTRR